LLRTYSNIPENEVESHLRVIRDKAFGVHPYGCIGKWNFLDLYMPDVPQYPEVVERVKAGEVLLDVGCCFGAVLRQLVADGASDENLRGADLQPSFIDLGYELFKDRDRFRAKFLTGDMTDPADRSFDNFNGTVDIVHAASFFHLFSREKQIRAGEKIAGFFKPQANALVFGRQRGRRQTMETDEPGERGQLRYFHNEQTWQAMWDEIGRRTGTRWK
ncbi:hypothetical protein M406DRAFT_222626, partial [Cryphonectria parasitica EP155]